jgi:hypothetical protein
MQGIDLKSALVWDTGYRRVVILYTGKGKGKGKDNGLPLDDA